MARDWVEDELWNWSRWANTGPWPGPMYPPRSGSAEGHYIVHGWGEEAPIPPHINYRNAEIVDKVYHRLSLAERRVLKAEYLSPWDYGRFSAGGIHVASRRLRISVREYERHLRAAREKIRREFG